MRVVVVGPGLMGAQIGCEYALGGHQVSFVARRPEAARERVDQALALVEELALYHAAAVDAGRARIDITDSLGWVNGGEDLVVE